MELSSLLYVLMLIVGFIGGILTRTFSNVLTQEFEKCRNKREKKREEKKTQLTSKRNSYDTCKRQVDYCIKNRVMKNEFQYPSDVTLFNIPEESAGKVEKFVEDYLRCADWFVACHNAVDAIMGRMIKDLLPVTQRTYDLRGFLKNEQFVAHYLRGEKISLPWLDANYPTLHKDIVDNLKESREQLATFFVQFNTDFENNQILVRFRKEKQELIEYGAKLMEELDHEIEKLDKEISSI